VQDRDLGVAEPQHVAQRDRLGQLRPQPGEGVEQIEPGRGDHAGAARIRDLGQRVVAAGGDLPAGAAVRRPGPVGGQPEHPRPESAAALEAGQSPGDGQQGVLARLLGVLTVGQQPGTHPQDLRAHRHEQQVEGGQIAGGGDPGQVFDIGSVHSASSPRSVWDRPAR
jgi:hypothetical protein